MHRLAERGILESSRRLPIQNFAEVDDRLWRGAAPTKEAMVALAAGGVRTLIDLRAEKGVETHDALGNHLGIKRIHLPLRDGQAPTRRQVERFLEAVEDSPRRVFVHCGAGVGRTGTMAAAYLVTTGRATAKEAVKRNLSVGPPSVEQLAFAILLGGGELRRPPVPVVAFSRAVDGPRRCWVRVRGSYADRSEARQVAARASARRV